MHRLRHTVRVHDGVVPSRNLLGRVLVPSGRDIAVWASEDRRHPAAAQCRLPDWVGPRDVDAEPALGTSIPVQHERQVRDLQFPTRARNNKGPEWMSLNQVVDPHTILLT